MTRLAAGAGRKGWLVPLGLVTVLVSNVFALFLPFLDIDVVFKGATQYKLPESVKLMWEAKLYWVAILIVGFSIIFPIAKTIGLLLLWFGRVRIGRRRRSIRILETLGKWSMLDIFVVILLMTLSNEQFFLSTIPRVGLLFFIFAIIGNMVMSRIVAVIDERVHPDPDALSVDPERILPLARTGGLGWALPLLLIVSLVSILVAVDVPFLRINDIMLHSDTYSVIDASSAMWAQGHYALAGFLVLFVGVVPAVRILLIGWVWFSRRTRAQHLRGFEWIRISGEWSMMSVFLLALVMIMTEGQEMVQTQMRDGLWAIIASTALCVSSLWLARWLMERTRDRSA